MNQFTKCAVVKVLGIKTAEVLAHSSIDTFPLTGDPAILQSDNRQSVSSTVSSIIYYWPELKNSAQKVPPQSEAGERQMGGSRYCNMVVTSMQDEKNRYWTGSLRSWASHSCNLWT